MATYLIFNVSNLNKIDALWGATSSAPANNPKRQYKPEYRSLPHNMFDGRTVKGVTVYVYDETERQFKPSLFYAELTDRDGREQFAAQKTTKPVLDRSLALG